MMEISLLSIYKNNLKFSQPLCGFLKMTTCTSISLHLLIPTSIKSLSSFWKKIFTYPVLVIIFIFASIFLPFRILEYASLKLLCWTSFNGIQLKCQCLLETFSDLVKGVCLCWVYCHNSLLLLLLSHSYTAHIM